MGRAVLTVILMAAFTIFPMQSIAAELTSVKVRERANIPAVRPKWPIPNDTNQIFYLQRSTNSNTIVYRVNFDSAGNINPRDPADVYWRRFNTDGVAKPLKTIEHLAFGIKSRPRDTPGEYVVTLRRLPQIPMLLRQSGPNQAELWANIGGKLVRPVYAFAKITGSGLSQRVERFSIHGIDPSTGRAISETFAVAGGAIRP